MSRIYLAGKIAQGDWRHTVVNGLRDALYYHEYNDWPILERSILGQHDYVGPFFVGCDHGCYHGPGSHGSGARADDSQWLGKGTGCSGLSPSQGPEVKDVSLDVARKCRRSIGNADLVYAWVDDPTAYGTLVEIGFALAAPTRRLVVLAHPPGRVFDRGGNRADAEDPAARLSDLWFLPRFVQACGGITIEANDAVEGLLKALDLRTPRPRAVASLAS